jgi:hypothetical protein
MQTINQSATLFHQLFLEPQPERLNRAQMGASAADSSVQYARHRVAPAAAHPRTIALVVKADNSFSGEIALALMQMVFAKVPME